MYETILLVGAASIFGVLAAIVTALMCLVPSIRAAVREDWDRK